MVMMVLADRAGGWGRGCTPMNFVCAAQALNPYHI